MDWYIMPLSILKTLAGAGLSHFTGSFSDVDETEFLSLQVT
jgi:hypothetical protein